MRQVDSGIASHLKDDMVGVLASPFPYVAAAMLDGHPVHVAEGAPAVHVGEIETDPPENPKYMKRLSLRMPGVYPTERGAGA